VASSPSSIKFKRPGPSSATILSGIGIGSEGFAAHILQLPNAVAMRPRHLQKYRQARITSHDSH